MNEWGGGGLHYHFSKEGEMNKRIQFLKFEIWIKNNPRSVDRNGYNSVG